MQVEHVDFVSFLTQDMARARAFYAETLGLEIETEGESDIEFRPGQVTLDIFDPELDRTAIRPEPRRPRSPRVGCRFRSDGAGVEGRRIRGRDDRHGRMSHGVLPRS